MIYVNHVYQLSVSRCRLLPLVVVGFVFLAILWILNAIFVIIAAIQASDGKFYRYPMTIRFIQ